MINQRMKGRRKPVRSGISVCVCGIAATVQNNTWAGLPLMDDLVRANTDRCVLFSFRRIGLKSWETLAYAQTSRIVTDSLIAG
jgi:hypothetical protein